MAEPILVRVTRWHTHDGVAHEPDTTYSVDPELLETLETQGLVVRAEAAAPAPAPEEAEPAGKRKK